MLPCLPASPAAAPSAHPTPAPAGPPAPVAAWLHRARAAIAAGHTADALEALCAASAVDIQQHRQHYLASAVQAGEVADLYAQALAPIAAVAPPFQPPPPPSGQLRIAYLVPNLVQGQAASLNVVRYAECHDRDRFDVHAVITDELFARTPPSPRLHLPSLTSSVAAGPLLSRLRAAATVHLLPSTGDLLTASAAALRPLRALGFHAAIFVASPACPIQATLAALRLAPRQYNLNIGVPLLSPGIDAVIYNNHHRAEADLPELTARKIARHTALTAGGNAREIAARVAGLDRARIAAQFRATLDPAVPPDAPLLLSIANQLPTRMLHGTFTADLARFLKAHPQAHFLAVGGQSEAYAPVLRQLASAGVADRVRTLASQSDILPTLLAADLLLNEYPEGGGNTVIEAMAAGLPVVALHAGERHAEHIGALLLGPQASRTHHDYWSAASALLTDPGLRAARAAEARDRALNELDYTAITACYQRILSGDLSQPPSHAAPLPTAA